MYYQVADYKDIIARGFSQKLSDDSISAIHEMCTEMNVAFFPNKLRDFSVVATPPTHTKDSLMHNRRRNHGKGMMHDLGGSVAGGITFKATAIPKKEGFDQKLNEIRVCLNKISAKNADAQYASLIELVRGVFSDHEFESDEGRRTIQTILDICQLNKFYSEIYTRIYIKLVDEYPVFGGARLQENFDEVFMRSFEKIRYVDPNVNYDEFCAYNKENDARKSRAMFYINLAKMGEHFDRRKIVECIASLLALVYRYIDEEGRTNEVEEITENINVFFVNMHADLAATPEWDEILEKIQDLSQKKHTSHLSITNRAIFKYMDMMEL